MCGIVGQISLDGRCVGSLPLESLQHRGPDAKSEWTNRRNCILGHTRLSVIDLNPRADQPMTDPSGRFTLVFNGEIYNYKELRQSYLPNEQLRTTSDTEVVIADVTGMTTDTYAETAKKWIGQVTYTIQNAGAGTHTTFTAVFNYGFSKYNDIGNSDFQLQQFDAVGRAGGSDSSFDLEVLHHKTTGWTYHASAFVAGAAPIVKLSTLYSTESDLANGEAFAFKRTGLSTNILGNGEEGFLVRVTTGTNNSVEFLDFGVTVALN